MKELREYQQSEAYKMCTEKIQEKKIKKGWSWEPRLLAAPLPEPPGDAGLVPGVTPFLLPRGRGLCGSEHPAERASAQGKAPAALPVCGETEAHGTAGFGLWELVWLQVWAEGDSRVVLQGASFSLKRSLERQEAASSHPLPAQAGPPLAPSLCLLAPRTWGPLRWARP